MREREGGSGERKNATAVTSESEGSPCRCRIPVEGERVEEGRGRQGSGVGVRRADARRLAGKRGGDSCVRCRVLEEVIEDANALRSMAEHLLYLQAGRQGGRHTHRHAHEQTEQCNELGGCGFAAAVRGTTMR